MTSKGQKLIIGETTGFTALLTSPVLVSQQTAVVDSSGSSSSRAIHRSKALVLVDISSRATAAVRSLVEDT